MVITDAKRSQPGAGRTTKIGAMGGPQKELLIILSASQDVMSAMYRHVRGLIIVSSQKEFQWRNLTRRLKRCQIVMKWNGRDEKGGTLVLKGCGGSKDKRVFLRL